MTRKDPLTRIRTHLKTLNLGRMEKSLDDVLARAERDACTIAETLERLLAIEADALTERRIERRVKESRLPDRKLLADFDFAFQTGIDKARIMELSTLGFLERNQGLILAGNSGTGKSHIAKALMLLACQKGYRCRYTTAADMLAELMAAGADDTLGRKLKTYVSPDLLLIDELGFDRLEQHDARNASFFLKVIDGRYAKKPILLTTNIDFKQLGDYLGDPVITTAAVDRLVHHSIIMTVQGPSWRMHESKKLNAEIKKTSSRKK